MTRTGMRSKRITDEIGDTIDNFDGPFAIGTSKGIGENRGGRGDKTALAIWAVQPVGQFHRRPSVPCL
ncbi:MAG TPA: hypothetical protein VH023_02655 [Rhodopila sp.]|nr:hypothetical protein [Rhodopila sp.]